MERRKDVDIFHHYQTDIPKILDEHLSFREYAEYCRKEHKLSQRVCSQNWQGMWEIIREKFVLEKDKLVSKHLNRYWDLYDRAITQRDLTNARQALNDIAKLQGLYEPDKLEVKQDTIIEFKFGGDDTDTTDEV
jgi:hypothetical protein